MIPGGTIPGMPIADQLKSLTRADFPDLKTAEVKVLRAATTTRQAQCGPQADVADPSNNPESKPDHDRSSCRGRARPLVASGGWKAVGQESDRHSLNPAGEPKLPTVSQTHFFLDLYH